MNELIFVDRYTALGIPYPKPETVCQGQCEGTGFVPIQLSNEEPWRSLWLAAEKLSPTGDSFHFVKCPDCNGTGKRQDTK